MELQKAGVKAELLVAELAATKGAHRAALKAAYSANLMKAQKLVVQKVG